MVDIGAIDEIGGADARIPLVRWIENGVPREERTTTPGALVARLGEPEGLEVVRPSLEDIYLELVGVSTGSTSMSGDSTSMSGDSTSMSGLTTEGAAL
jgi:ABC-2 type transport system ATP-binding protein